MDELHKLVEESNLFPLNPHPLIAELLPFVVVLQQSGAVSLARDFIDGQAS